VTVGDTRLANAANAVGGPFADGSVVAGGDGDIGTALVSFTATEKHENFSGSTATFNFGNADLNTPPPYVTGRFGRALDFDGIDDLVIGPPDGVGSVLDIIGPFTLEAWVDFDLVGGTAGNTPIVAKWGDTTFGTAGYGLFINSDGTLLLAISTTGSNVISVTSGLVSAVGFHHVAGVFTGSKLKIYIDGALGPESADLGATVVNANNVPVLIGAYSPILTGPSGFFDGLIDEVRIWSVGLTAEEVAASAGVGFGSDGIIPDGDSTKPCVKDFDPTASRNLVFYTAAFHDLVATNDNDPDVDATVSLCVSAAANYDGSSTNNIEVSSVSSVSDRVNSTPKGSNTDYTASSPYTDVKTNDCIDVGITDVDPNGQGKLPNSLHLNLNLVDTDADNNGTDDDDLAIGAVGVNVQFNPLS